jgi:membrane protein DedA with SNARE-associated domain
MGNLELFIHDGLFQMAPLVRNIVIFALSYAEGLPIIGSIVLGGTVAILIGTLSEQGFIQPLLAVNLIAIGSFLGDITGFVFGKQLRRLPIVRRLVEDEKHQKHWELFDRHIALVIIFGKLLPVVRSTPSLFAGARNMSKLRYALYVLIGSYLWAFVGVYGGNLIARYLGGNAIVLVLVGAIMISIVFWLGGKFLKGNKKHQ